MMSITSLREINNQAPLYFVSRVERLFERSGNLYFYDNKFGPYSLTQLNKLRAPVVTGK